MTAQDYKILADTLGQILNGNMVGFVIMAVVVGFLGFAVAKLYKQMVQNAAACEQERQSCQKERLECHTHLAMIAEAQIRQSVGHAHEARTLAETVRDGLISKGVAGHTATNVVAAPEPKTLT